LDCGFRIADLLFINSRRLISIDCRATAPVVVLNMAGDAPALQSFLGHDGACPSKLGRVHEEHGDHAAEEGEGCDCGDAEHSQAHGITRG